jgi:hypothetical protein
MLTRLYDVMACEAGAVVLFLSLMPSGGGNGADSERLRARSREEGARFIKGPDRVSNAYVCESNVVFNEQHLTAWASCMYVAILYI